MALSDQEILKKIGLPDDEILKQLDGDEVPMAESAIRGFSQGATVGFGDEINASLVATRKALTRQLAETVHGGLPVELQSSFSDDYAAERDKERSRNTQSAEDNPVTHMGTEFAAGAVQSLGGLGAAKGIGGQTLKQALPKLAGVGAVEGGIAGTGYSEGESAGEVAGDTAMGAGWGMAGAMAIPSAMQGVGRAYQRLVKNRGQKAADMVTADLRKAGYSPEEAAEYLQMNPEMIVGDIGENLKWRTADLATSPSQGAEDIKDLLLTRNQNQLEGRVEPFFKEALGGNSGEGFEQTLKSAQKQLSAQAKPLYDEAEKLPTRLTDEMKAVLNTQDGQDALQLAARKAERDNVAFGPAPTARLMHYVGRAFGDMADNVGKYTDGGQQFLAMRRKILDGVKDQNEPFRLAQSIYADGKAVQDAFEEGTKALTGNALVKVDRIADMSQAEKVAMRSGLFQGVLQKLGAKPDTADVSRIFRQPNVRKVLKAAFDDPEKFTEFEALVKREGIMSETAQAALYGSRTKPLTSFGDDAAAIGEAAMTGDPATLLGRYLMKKGMDARGEGFRNELAPLLGAKGDNVLELLTQKKAREPYQVTNTIQKLTGAQ